MGETVALSLFLGGQRTFNYSPEEERQCPDAWKRYGIEISLWSVFCQFSVTRVSLGWEAPIHVSNTERLTHEPHVCLLPGSLDAYAGFCPG